MTFPQSEDAQKVYKINISILSDPFFVHKSITKCLRF